MELKIFELEHLIKFLQDSVNVLEIENKNYFREVVGRFFQIKDNFECKFPFIFTINGEDVELKNNFEIISSPFDLYSFNKNISTKLNKYCAEKLQSYGYDFDIVNAIELIKLRFNDFLLDLELDLVYNESMNLQDVVKILSPKMEFDNWNNPLINYKKIIEIISRLKLYKFIL